MNLDDFNKIRINIPDYLIERYEEVVLDIAESFLDTISISELKEQLPVDILLDEFLECQKHLTLDVEEECWNCSSN